ncbi:DUF4435 domain-containing protein [Cobetia amphilecti]|uniref:DUF4435 domain-containing protein n=1 Tax=Cobetia amphilecti TaxID=1055104 RepID=UPI001CDAC089|nr:DUF4435 domain-containing protein [Cobetia amphilecti]UBU50047.1 DUF4435 domain-containing protein [Cobetia amphilecti]
MTNSLVEKLRDSRSSPSVLRDKLIRAKGGQHDKIIFVFEGFDDVGVYEEWIKKINDNIEFEPIPGKGKRQLLDLHKSLVDKNDKNISNTLFFVDHDFDKDNEYGDNVCVLNGYSIENFLCSKSVLNSLLKDEYRCAGEVDIREDIIANFEKCYNDFCKHFYDINYYIFSARREKVEIVKKPERVTNFVNVEVDKITPKEYNVEEVVLFGGAVDISKHQQDYSLLSSMYSVRGKYILDFFKKWLAALTDDRKSANSILFNRDLPKITGEPHSFELRRLASASAPPESVNVFIQNWLLTKL